MSFKNTILEKIVDAKKQEISSAKFRESLNDLRAKVKDAAPTRDFLKVLDPYSYQGELPEIRIIAEIKKASPSGGLICSHFDPVKIAQDYLEAGAAALSVLTDPPFFQGTLADLEAVRKVSHRPILRKDFMIDPYQIYQARAYGADCILAIVGILDPSQLEDFCGLASELQMKTLLEVHDQSELECALRLKSQIELVGVNNRDLKTLKVDLSTTERLMPLIPSPLTVISESGFQTPHDIQRIAATGVKGFLVGEHLLKATDLKKKFGELIGV